MKTKILLFAVMLFAVVMTGCKQHPPAPKIPTREEIIRLAFESALVSELNDPNSYEFDTIYCAYSYTTRDQIDKIVSRLNESADRYESWADRSSTGKRWLEDKVKCENAVHKLDSLRNALAFDALNDTVARCYSFQCRANNAFGGKMKSIFYLMCNDNNEIIEYFQTDNNPNVSKRMILPILALLDHPVSGIVGEDQSIVWFSDSNDKKYWYEFRELLNL